MALLLNSDKLYIQKFKKDELKSKKMKSGKKNFCFKNPFEYYVVVFRITGVEVGA